MSDKNNLIEEFRRYACGVMPIDLINMVEKAIESANPTAGPRCQQGPSGRRVSGMAEFHEGQYIIYKNGDSYEIGKIKRITPDGALVWYSCGDTAAKTPFDCMHPIINDYVIDETGLGGCMT